MASILRQIVAGPRLQHPEARLDLCYVADNIIATSGPSTNYPKLAYRTPLRDLVNFLDNKHGENWCIWEFRAEGTGYPDSEVYGRIHHFPFPDHHPPPFALIPKVVASMRNWLQRLDGASLTKKTDGEQAEAKEQKEEKGQRVAVVHCKAGKGRSGTIACSYLISQEGWRMEDALQRFTERRMRVGFGSGVSIPSQQRWVRYVNQWTNEMGKKYIERPVEILEIHIWGLRDGVKVAVEGFVEDGQKIKRFHLFHQNERTVMPADWSAPNSTSNSAENSDNANTRNTKINPKNKKNRTARTKDKTQSTISAPQEPLCAESDSSLLTANLSPPSSLPSTSPSTPTEPTITTPATTATTASAEQPTKYTTGVLLRPSKSLLLPTSDINIDFERRSKAAPYTGLAMVTTIAHVWFNPYFEGGDKYNSGVFEVDWDDMDGIKGTLRKGIKALDRVKVVWRYAEEGTSMAGLPGVGGEDENANTRPVSRGVITEPRPGEPIPETRPADWRLKGTDPNADEERDGDEDGDDSSVEGPERDQENVPLGGLGKGTGAEGSG